MKVNRDIRAKQVRLIGHEGEQIGVVDLYVALAKAEEVGLELVEISPGSNPPVCKIMNYGKFRYDQTKREKESKKSQHQVKVKEIKLKPNIDEHDVETKLKHARKFLQEGNKVKFTCMFRGREMAHPEFGERVLRKMSDSLKDIATSEAPAKMFGRSLTMVLAPGVKKKSEPSKQGNQSDESEKETATE